MLREGVRWRGEVAVAPFSNVHRLQNAVGLFALRLVVDAYKNFRKNPYLDEEHAQNNEQHREEQKWVPGHRLVQEYFHENNRGAAYEAQDEQEDPGAAEPIDRFGGIFSQERAGDEVH